ncbi:MAG: hypothetical protein IAI50_09315 [Candidatus Eremiobacteraeota bacterium]|nr:hypothetical protein [Candidatus Eremiobacteraeota bacterium]
MHAANRNHTHLAPIDLQLLAGLYEESSFAHYLFARTMSAHVILHDGAPTSIASILQFIEDPLCGPTRFNFIGQP